MSLEISAKEELDLLLRTIEEASKHIRYLLFILVVSSTYVLATAYSGDKASLSISLPILNSSVSQEWFLILSPMCIFFTYVYMHIYVQDLVRRLNVFEKLDIKTPNISKEILIFPWLLSIARMRNSDKNIQYVVNNIFAIVTIWWFGPLVLLTIFIRYMQQKEIAAFVPLTCLSLSLIYVIVSSEKIEKKRMAVEFSYILFCVVIYSFYSFDILPTLLNDNTSGSIVVLLFYIYITGGIVYGRKLKSFLIFKPLRTAISNVLFIIVFGMFCVEIIRFLIAI